MQVTDLDRGAADHHGRNTPNGNSDFGILKEIVATSILPRLDFDHAQPALRSIFQGIQNHDDASDVFLRIAATGERLSRVVDELAHQACAAGILWEEDQIDLHDVTTRLARLQFIARLLSSKLERAHPHPKRRILLMPCPRETHVFGLQLLAMTFRDAGWAVTTSGATPEWPGDALARSPYDVVGLSVSDEHLLPLLRDEIRRLRRASRNQSLRVLVGGPCFDRGDADVDSVGADAYAPDAGSAPMIADEIVMSKN